MMNDAQLDELFARGQKFSFERALEQVTQMTVEINVTNTHTKNRGCFVMTPRKAEQFHAMINKWMEEEAGLEVTVSNKYFGGTND